MASTQRSPEMSLNDLFDQSDERIKSHFKSLVDENKSKEDLEDRLNKYIENFQLLLNQLVANSMDTMGYYSIEATKAGLVKWANGSIEKEVDELKTKMSKFLDDAAAFGIKGTKEKKASDDDKDASEQYMRVAKLTAENYVKADRRINKAKFALQYVVIIRQIAELSLQANVLSSSPIPQAAPSPVGTSAEQKSTYASEGATPTSDQSAARAESKKASALASDVSTTSSAPSQAVPKSFLSGLRAGFLNRESTSTGSSATSGKTPAPAKR